MQYLEIPLGWAADVTTWRGESGVNARMVVYHRGQLLATYLVTQLADYPSISAKLWEKALEMIERRQICSGGPGAIAPA